MFQIDILLILCPGLKKSARLVIVCQKIYTPMKELWCIYKRTLVYLQKNTPKVLQGLYQPERKN